MKTRIQDKSTKSAIKLAKEKSKVIHTILENVKNESDLQAVMPKLRNCLAELNQRIHEANAYNNAYNNIQKNIKVNTIKEDEHEVLQTITINGVEVTKPLESIDDIPPKTIFVYAVNTAIDVKFSKVFLPDNSTTRIKELIERKIVHLTPESAIVHTDALLSLMKNTLTC